MYQEPLISSEVFDNAPRAYRHIEVVPHAASMGAEVRGVRIAELSDQAFAEVEDALFRHKAIYLRGQRIDHEQQARFTRRFGPPEVDPYRQDRMDVHPEVTSLIKAADVKLPAVFGGGWHTDSAFMERPPAITILRSVTVPPWGGDTMFANAALAYKALSATMKSVIDPLKVWMSSERNATRLAAIGALKRGFTTPEGKAKAFAGTMHPLVRTHPRTGEKALFVGGYASGIEGMTEDESSAIIDFLMRHVLLHLFTCRIRWEPDMVLLWDNRLALHFAMNDYDGYRREMYRSMVAGEVPV